MCAFRRALFTHHFPGKNFTLSTTLHTVSRQITPGNRIDCVVSITLWLSWNFFCTFSWWWLRLLEIFKEAKPKTRNPSTGKPMKFSPHSLMEASCVDPTPDWAQLFKEYTIHGPLIVTDDFKFNHTIIKGYSRKSPGLPTPSPSLHEKAVFD